MTTSSSVFVYKITLFCLQDHLYIPPHSSQKPRKIPRNLGADDLLENQLTRRALGPFGLGLILELEN